MGDRTFKVPRTIVIHGDRLPKGALMQNQSGPGHPRNRPFPSLDRGRGRALHTGAACFPQEEGPARD